jgi:hypothetical protein
VEAQTSEVFWTCSCGSKVKAGLDMTEASATVRCPNPLCQLTRTLPGQIMQLSVETALGTWTGMDVMGLCSSESCGLPRDRPQA